MKKQNSLNKLKYGLNRGFTIVELLVVIVVIGILAAITVVSYTGISQKAIAVSLQSDLASAKKKLQMYYTDYGSYPTAPLTNNCPTSPVNDPKYCLKTSSGNTFTYTLASGLSPAGFRLDAEHTASAVKYRITNDVSPELVTDISSLTCPTGFIPVPGSSTYNTNNFCVMKYEAKNVAGVATSQPELTPWVSISQTTAMTTATAACSGCHLITEAEWMTIAQNVLSVPSNWSTGTVGSGFIFSGHNDNAPANALAVTNPADGYSDTGNVSPSNQKRSLTLTNGEVIWDLAGNVWEWTNGQTTGGQPGITNETGYAWKEWTATPMTTGSLAVNPFPASTNITGASTWNATNGIGRLYSYVNDNNLRGFFRGGYWNFGSYDGVLALSLIGAPTYTPSPFGFRVSR